MDPVTHLVFGRTVAFTLPRQSLFPGVTLALVLGSILPDADALIALRGFDRYLQAHSSGTHSFLGALVGGALLTLLLRLVVTESRTLPLLLASWVGVFGHIFWDLADGSDIRLFKPFSEALFGWHLFAMGDPIVLLVLVTAVVLAWWRPSSAFRIAIGTLVLLLAVLGMKKTTQEWARGSYAAFMVGQHPLAVTPVWGHLFCWTIYDRVDGNVRGWRVDGSSGDVKQLFEYRDEARSPIARVSRALPVVQTFLGFSTIPFARVEEHGASRVVLWSDATNCSARSCDVSFGGGFDSNTAPLFEVIQVGRLFHTQPLPAPR